MNETTAAGGVLGAACLIQASAIVLDRITEWHIASGIMPVTAGLAGLALLVLIGSLVQSIFQR